MAPAEAFPIKRLVSQPQANSAPVALFVYARPDHTERILQSLKDEQVSRLYIFSDGAADRSAKKAVAEVRKLVRSIDWVETRISERWRNLGLGRSILTGVTDVFKREDRVIVFEDDLEIVPGIYAFFCAALDAYADAQNVFSVTAWNHEFIRPPDVHREYYFTDWPNCWSWATWRRAWIDMDRPALELMRACERKGLDVYKYGRAFPEMARSEKERNVWAVRHCYQHLLHGGLCLYPPVSMVSHIGAGVEATNCKGQDAWSFQNLSGAPPLPDVWPRPVPRPGIPELWRRAMNGS